MDWSQAGVIGGIPSRTTLCATLNPGATAAQINAAVAACPAGQAVFLNAGTYTLSSGLVIDKSSVTLRGAGASQTKLFINGTTSGCALFYNSAVRMCAGSGNIGTTSGGSPGPDHTATWTSGYSQGTSVIVLSNTTGMQVGSTLFLDQLNDASDGYPAAGDLYLCDGAQPCSWEGGNSFARVGRVQTEPHLVTAINGSSVTISPPILAPNFRASQSPGAWWGNSSVVLQNSGIEDMSIDFTGGGGAGVEMVNNTNTWLKGVRLLQTGGPGSFVIHVLVVNGFHVTVKDNYLYGPTVQGNTQYGYAPHVSGSLLFENNILHHDVSPTAPNDPEVGSVYAYNYVDDGYYATSGFQQHNGGDMLNLFEGNNAGTMASDSIHGTHFFLTYFRNHLDGQTHNPGGNSMDGGLIFWSHNRFHNAIGNVLGAASYTTYETDMADGFSSVYGLGFQGSHGGAPLGNDANVARTLMRWGNWDNVSNTTRWLASEVPSGIASFANPVPASQVLPASFYLPALPAWWATPWGTPKWPPIGPDVTGGNVSNSPTGGHADKVPARLCFEHLSDDPAYASSSPRIKLFDAKTCYTSGGGGPYLWSGILDPNRAADWSGAGVVGGLPNYTNLCTTAACNTVSSGTVTATSLQNALASCPANGVVRVPAGTFSVGAFNFTKSGCALRGAGADKTKLVATSGQSGGGLGGSNNPFIHLMSGATGLGAFGGVTTANWTGPYALGTTVITLSNTSGLVAGPVGTGSILFLDQADDASDGWPAPGDIYSCASTSNGCSNQGGNNYARPGRAQVQAVTVTAINGSQVTITPGVAYPNFRASQNPGAYWNNGSPVGNSGIEDMTIDFSPTGVQGIYVINAANWWIKGCRLLSTATGTQETYHVFVIQSVHGTVRSNYIYGRPTTVNPFPLANYAYTDNESGDIVLENNIFDHNTGSVVPNDPAGRNVFAYNFMVNDDVGIAGMQMHSGNVMMNLYEGNNLWSFLGDDTHGSHHFQTFFRNHFDGTSHNGPSSTVASALLVETNNRFFNAVGNVCGALDYGRYQADMIGNWGSGETAACFNTGWAGNNSGAPISDDANVGRTFLRWGNWDLYTSSNRMGSNDASGTRFLASEVPSAIPNFPNPVPASQNLPPSFYLSAKPAWFGSVPFPPIGPDVSNGNAPNTAAYPTGGHANKIPARLCYESAAADPAYSGSNPPIKAFNADACYGSGGGDTTPPGVAIVSPANGTTVSGTITVSGTASDNVSVSNVAVSIDGGAYSPASGTTSWSFALNTTALSNAAHTITAKATDSSGNTAAVSISVTVNNGGGGDTTPPTVSISTPAEGSNVSGSVMLSANAADNVGVVRVDFYDDGSKFATTKSPPYSAAWKTTNKRNGSRHTLTATATDAAGNQTSASVTVTVSNPLSANATVPGLRSAYAYPSPAVSGQDPVIRALLGWADGVEVSIYDMGGRLVNSARLDGTPTGIMNGEYYYDYPWTGAKSSGVYFAVIHGKSSDGTIVRARVRFAVVR